MAVGSGRLAFWQIGLPTLRVHRSLGKGMGGWFHGRCFLQEIGSLFYYTRHEGLFRMFASLAGNFVLENNKHVYMYNFCV